MESIHFQLNHLTKPIGINGNCPRFTWNVKGCKEQSAFQLRYESADQTVVFDSGKIAGSRMYYESGWVIPFKTRGYVYLTVWDDDHAASEPNSLYVVTGIRNDDWKAKWINPELTIPKREHRTAGYLKKKFKITEDQYLLVHENGAFFYGTCHGLMNVYINGREITDHQLMPGRQQYNKRLMVETIDVSGYLKKGTNEILVSLGDGFYRGALGGTQAKNVYGIDIALLAQIETAGMILCKTDETWEATSEGPIRKNDMMFGEEYDATKEELTGFHKVKTENFGYDNLIAIDTVPVLPKETFQPKWIDTPNHEKVLDFGQNLVGYVCLDFIGTQGQKLILTHGEVLDEAGNFTIENFQFAGVRTEQKIEYTCKNGRNIYHPTKTYMGFRYVKVEGDVDLQPEEVTAVAIYSDMEVTSRFECGVGEVNQLFKNSIWSMKGNFVDVPTDCPTREKSGFSGDCQAFIHTAMYLMDCYPVYAKWLREQAAGQYSDGNIPQISPKCTKPDEHEKIVGVMVVDGGIGWADSFEIVPYKLAKRYGDPTLIREYYEVIKIWTDYEIKRAKQTRLFNRRILPREHREYMIDKGWMWGEWLEPNQNPTAYMKNILFHGDPEVGTAFLYLNLCYLIEMAKLLGIRKDITYYETVAEKVKKAYRAVYTDHGKVKEKKRQCRFVRPIVHNLLTEEEKYTAAKDLARLIRENQDHLNTGFLTTHELSRTLTRYGQNRTAYDLLLQREMPGWLFSVTKGCTTIPEDWDCFHTDGRPKDSFNHYSYGAISGWLMDSAAGIIVEDGKIVIRPNPDPRLGYLKASYDSPYGTITSNWNYDENGCHYHIEIPPNMQALVCIKGQEEKLLGSGKYDI